MKDRNATYCVVLHSSGSGYVVHTAYGGWLPQPYTDAKRVAEYEREKAAQNKADDLNYQRAKERSQVGPCNICGASKQPCPCVSPTADE